MEFGFEEDGDEDVDDCRIATQLNYNADTGYRLSNNSQASINHQLGLGLAWPRGSTLVGLGSVPVVVQVVVDSGTLGVGGGKLNLNSVGCEIMRAGDMVCTSGLVGGQAGWQGRGVWVLVLGHG